jgi:hypothetical protein
MEFPQFFTEVDEKNKTIGWFETAYVVWSSETSAKCIGFNSKHDKDLSKSENLTEFLSKFKLARKISKEVSQMLLANKERIRENKFDEVFKLISNLQVSVATSESAYQLNGKEWEKRMRQKQDELWRKLINES